ncbi:MAG: WHG domain-containing protein, partial [Alphaproteobacteria bacterium]|nr:WHG domain-containing protein [Alphaproteobacteria bacterium]
PYRHYRDKDDLLADLARIGFERFGAALLSAWDHGKPDPKSALIRVGRSYLDFARQNPALYTTMFDSSLSIAARPDLSEVADASFQVLRMACDTILADFTKGPKPPALMVALHIWSLSHGIAGLFVRPDRSPRPIPIAPDELLEAAVLIYLDGLKASPKH